MDSWLGVELRHLVTLAAIQEERSFRGAAKRLGYVQSAVSQQLASLERLIGVRLVDRTRGHAGVELTESGTVLLRHAERILSELAAARADLRSLEDGNRQTMRLGLNQSLSTRLLPRTLTRLAEEAPDVGIRAREELSDSELFGPVLAGELDVGLAELPLEPGPFESRTLFVDPLLLLVPADSELAGRVGPIGLAEIAAERLVADPTWRMFELIADEFAVAGLELQPTLTARTNAGVQALVAAGLGAAVMPRLAADLRDPAVAAVPLDQLFPRQTVVAFWHRDRHLNGAFDTLLDVMEGVGTELAAPATEQALDDAQAS